MAAVVAALVAALAGPSWARAAWKKRIDRAIGGHSVGVVVREHNKILYNHGGRIRRVPASNEKLLTSMAAFQNLGPDDITQTLVTAHTISPTIEGNVFIFGHGDPAVSSPSRYARSLPFTPTRIAGLARQIRSAGVRRIRGSVIGSTTYFSHDWFTWGWKPDFPRDQVALASALAYNGNVVRGTHISNPELRAARSLTNQLEKIGVKVGGKPGAKPAPGGLAKVAMASSQPLDVLLRYMDVNSVNWYAEMMAKRVGAARFGPPGTIAKGAKAIRTYAAARHVSLAAYDGSGLSYANRVSPLGLVRLLHKAAREPWGEIFRNCLASGGRGTLAHRDTDITIKAKTGTLTNISALSGYVWLERDRMWAEFSILDSGMPKWRASNIEDRIVHIVAGSAMNGSVTAPQDPAAQIVAGLEATPVETLLAATG